jgi:hypothetical protein
MEIYRITNKINNKIYIGQSIHSRNGYFGSGPIIKSAIKKYGKNNFKKDIIWSGTTTREILNEMEIYYIELENTLSPNGYNICKGGNTNDGITNNPNKEKIIEKIKQSMLNSSKCKRPFELNGQYKIVSNETRTMVYKLYNDGFSDSQIFKNFNEEIKLTRKKINSIIREGIRDKNILTDEQRKDNYHKIEKEKLLGHINEFGNSKKGLISYISKKTNHSRRTIRELLKKHNLYDNKVDVENKKSRIYLSL